MSNYLTHSQVEQILRPINPSRVSSRDGMAYVEAYDVRAHMARIFGVARWSSEVIEQHLICEDKVQTRQGKDAWYVAYRSIVKVTVCAPDGTVLAVYTEGHAGDSTHPVKGEAHGNAITNSESYAFKRSACMALLDQGGLSLYGKGSTAALVKRTLVMPDEEAPLETPVDHDVPAVIPEATDGSRAPAVEQAPDPAATPPAEPPQAAGVQELRDRVLTALKLPDKSKALKALIDVQLAASKQKALQTATTTPAGEQTTLGDLIATAQKLVSGRDGLHRPQAVAS